MNSAIVIGRVTTPMILRHTRKGTPFIRFTVAVDRPSFPGASTQTTDFIPITAWSQLAQAQVGHVEPGTLLAVQGIMTSLDRTQRGVSWTEIHLAAQHIHWLARPSQAATAPPSSSQIPELLVALPEDVPF